MTIERAIEIIEERYRLWSDPKAEARDAIELLLEIAKASIQKPTKPVKAGAK